MVRSEEVGIVHEQNSFFDDRWFSRSRQDYYSGSSGGAVDGFLLEIVRSLRNRLGEQEYETAHLKVIGSIPQ
jgi:hypothetical protein